LVWSGGMWQGLVGSGKARAHSFDEVWLGAAWWGLEGPVWQGRAWMLSSDEAWHGLVRLGAARGGALWRGMGALI